MRAARGLPEESVEDPVPLFRVDLFGQLHRAFDVREQDRDLLALALERCAVLQNSIGKMFRRVRLRDGVSTFARCAAAANSASSSRLR